MIKIQVLDHTGTVLAETDQALQSAVLLYDQEYQEGDFIRFISSDPGYFEIMLDDTLGTADVYLTAASFEWKIPFDLERKRFNPRAFFGMRHLITVRAISEWKRKQVRNLACNIYDTAANKSVYPHAWSNVITPEKPEFDAQNAIDGVIYPWKHGRYPFESWGINKREDAVWHLEFGRNVHVVKIIITLRADFPHDSWWRSADLNFSNGRQMKFCFNKTGEPQEFITDGIDCDGFSISNLIRADFSSEFPALAQVQAIGYDNVSVV